MGDRLYAWCVILAIGASPGCVARVEDPQALDDDDVLDHVEALGYPREGAIVLDDRVVVERDILLNRAALLRGAYERRPMNAAGELIQKGYWYESPIDERYQGNIRLRFATGDFAPTKAIRSAFVDAARVWSKVPGSAIRISTSNTGPAMVVRTVPTKRWAKYAGCSDTSACAYPPLDGRPGYDIFIRAEPKASAGCTGAWTPTMLAYMARHEIGHALGLAHPKEKNSAPVGETRTCSKATEKLCTYDPGYATIMSAPMLGGDCLYTSVRVTQDDYATCAALYPE